jgi:sugar lactone lactonase YvrE
VKLQTLHSVLTLTAIFAGWLASAADFRPPGGERFADASSISSAVGPVVVLPGGRLIKPLGAQIETGPGPFGLAVSPRGTAATADTGSERFGITIIEPPVRKNPEKVGHIWSRTPHSTAPEIAPPDWKGVTAGIAFDGEKSVWITEGESGKIRQLELSNGDHGRIVSLNTGEFSNSFTIDLAYDAARRILYVVDQANARMAAVDEKTGRVLSSVKLSAQAEGSVVRVEEKRAQAEGSVVRVEEKRAQAEGSVVSAHEEKAPFAIALSPDGMTAWVTEPNAVCAIDLHDPVKPGLAGCADAPSPQAVLVTKDNVYVSNARHDSVTVISTADRKVVEEIPLTIGGLAQYRGVIPAGMAWDSVNKWLLVAEAGINAVGIIDTEKNELIGHLPAGWMPTRVAIAGDRVYVANARGRGAGPFPRRVILELGEAPVLYRGSVATFVMPAPSELKEQTSMVYALNGFVPAKESPRLPAAIQHVVLIVKGGRTFDEVMGDVATAGNRQVVSLAKMAIFGMRGYADGGRNRFSVHDAPMTPNQHEIAKRWAFSDNFYAAGETKVEGEYWLNGGYPDPVTQSAINASRGAPATTALWDHLKRHGVTYRSVDAANADQAIEELGKSEPLPQFVRISLPDDRHDPDPDKGYPYEATYVAANDFAVGRIVDWLSHSPWWRGMAVFITETDTVGEIDHVDAHRTLLFAAGPYMKRNYVSHTNATVSGLMKTIYELLRLPAANLMDRTAAGLEDLFVDSPDFSPFSAVEPDARIYTPK